MGHRVTMVVSAMLSIGDTRHYITCHPLSDFPRGASPIHSVEVATRKPPYGVDRFVGSHYVGRLIDM